MKGADVPRDTNLREIRERKAISVRTKKRKNKKKTGNNQKFSGYYNAGDRHNDEKKKT